MSEELRQVYEKQATDLQIQIDELRSRLDPDQLAKSIDRSFLSVGNLRAFLQILSIILTIFVAGAVYFGSIGLTNILQIREEARKTESIRQSTEQVFSRVSAVEDQIQSKVTGVDQEISTLEAKTDSEISKLKEKVDVRIEEIDGQVKNVATNLKSISELFNKIAISHPDVLNAREKQLLTLLAKEIDPESPIFSFNAAHWAVSFRRYDEALAYLDVTLNSPDISPEIRQKAIELQAQAATLKANPPELKYQEAGGVTVGPYGIVAFPVNILNVLVQNGYLTLPQAQEVIDASKRK